MKDIHSNNKHITVLLAGGLLTPEKSQNISEIAGRCNLLQYVTTAQNLRLLGANDENIDEIKRALVDKGFSLKSTWKIPYGQGLCRKAVL